MIKQNTDWVIKISINLDCLPQPIETQFGELVYDSNDQEFHLYNVSKNPDNEPLKELEKSFLIKYAVLIKPGRAKRF